MSDHERDRQRLEADIEQCNAIIQFITAIQAEYDDEHPMSIGYGSDLAYYIHRKETLELDLYDLMTGFKSLQQGTASDDGMPVATEKSEQFKQRLLPTRNKHRAYTKIPATFDSREDCVNYIELHDLNTDFYCLRAGEYKRPYYSPRKYSANKWGVYVEYYFLDGEDSAERHWDDDWMYLGGCV